MARFNSAKMNGALDPKFQQAYNALIDLLDSAYIVEAMVNNKNIKVTMSPQSPFELSIDGIKETYITPEGILVPNRYDINEDGKVDITDVNLVKDYILTGTGYLPRMDVNGDGEVTLTDLLLVKQHCYFSLADPPGASGSGVSVDEDTGEVVITDASETTDGLLTMEDWATFNNKADKAYAVAMAVALG